MKIAIIYTGDVRTIEKTMEYFKKNVLINSNCHVYAVLQSNDTPYYTTYVSDNIGDNLKSLQWLDKNNNEWNIIKKNLLNTMYTTLGWKEYLSNSGSMIEYYQMHLAYKKIKEYEQKEENGFVYDYIMRIRCDVILTHPINFDWDTYSINEIKDFLYEIKNIYELESIVNQTVFNLFMNTIYYKPRLYYKEVAFDNYLLSDAYKYLFTLTEEEYIREISNYITKGKYITILRANQIYFIKRVWFNEISSLGITYGSSHIMQNNPYWFNAESQFKQICLENDIDVFDSTAKLEGKSIYEYCETNYFENNQLKTGEFLFFIRRN